MNRDKAIEYAKIQAICDKQKGRKMFSFEDNKTINKGDKIIQREYEKAYIEFDLEKWERENEEMIKEMNNE